MEHLSKLIEELAPCHTCDSMQRHCELMGRMLDDAAREIQRLADLNAEYERELDLKNRQVAGLMSALQRAPKHQMVA